MWRIIQWSGEENVISALSKERRSGQFRRSTFSGVTPRTSGWFVVHYFILLGDTEKKKDIVSLFCTPADSCWWFLSGRNSPKRNTVREVRSSVPPERGDPVSSGSDLNSICKGKRRRNSDHGVLSKERGRGYREGNARESDNKAQARGNPLQTPTSCINTPTSVAGLRTPSSGPTLVTRRWALDGHKECLRLQQGHTWLSFPPRLLPFTLSLSTMSSTSNTSSP
jgi:hypothetical protein